MSMHANISWRCKEEEIRSSEKQGSRFSQMQRCCQAPVLCSYTLLHLQGWFVDSTLIRSITLPLGGTQSLTH